jgi:tetratricopeptide (TPR) repeat protein
MRRPSLPAVSSSRLRRVVAFLTTTLALAGLAALTVWNVTRSEWLSRSRRAYAQGELSVSLQQALDHLKRQPWSREAALLAARCLSRLDYAADAEPYYQKAGELDLNDLQIRAFGLVRGNHRRQAIEAYEQILARWPDNITALRRLAAVQLSENNIPQLNALADRLIHTPGGAVMGYTLEGVVAQSERNYEGVVEAFEHVLAEDPDLRSMPLPRLLFWSHLAESLIKMGRMEDVSRYLTRVLEQAPDVSLMNTLGQAYFLRGMLDEAERCYRQAAEWDPKTYVTYYNLGKIELQRHRPHLALPHLEAARERAPWREDVLFSLASVYRLLNRPADVERTQELIRQAHKRARSVRNPKDPWPRYAL